MRIQAQFAFVDESVDITVDIFNDSPRAQIWEHPICNLRLSRGPGSIELRGVSLTELLSFLHLPIRRSLWPQIAEEEFGDALLSLQVGSFLPEYGTNPHEMRLRFEEDAGREFCVSFTEEQAERWAVALWEIRARLARFWNQPGT
jgi:hypothetical protein